MAWMCWGGIYSAAPICCLSVRWQASTSPFLAISAWKQHNQQHQHCVLLALPACPQTYQTMALEAPKRGREGGGGKKQAPYTAPASATAAAEAAAVGRQVASAAAPSEELIDLLSDSEDEGGLLPPPSATKRLKGAAGKAAAAGGSGGGKGDGGGPLYQLFWHRRVYTVLPAACDVAARRCSAGRRGLLAGWVWLPTLDLLARMASCPQPGAAGLETAGFHLRRLSSYLTWPLPLLLSVAGWC